MLRIKSKLRQAPLAVALLASTLAQPAFAQAQTTAQAGAIAINIPAQPASTALKAFVEQTKFQLIYSPDVVQGVTTKAVSGNLTPSEALAKLLEGTGLIAVSTGENAATLQKKSDVTALDMVIVSARKKDERMIDVPIAMSAMSGEDLRRRGASSVADVLQDSPGVSAFDYGQGLTKITIRGVSTTLGGNENGYYLNDLPFTGVTVPITPDVRAWDLDRIEILRGPQGTLFGEGSMGGTVRILTNRPRLEEFSFGGQLSGSKTSGGSDSNGQKLMLNIPLGEMLAVRLAATHEKFGGWIDDTANGRKDVNHSKIDTSRAAVLFEPTDRLRIDGSYWKYKANFAAGNAATDSNQVPPSTLENEIGYTVRGVTANYDFDSASLFYGFSSSSFKFPTSGPLFGGTLIATIDLRLKTHELRLGSTGNGPLKWTVGYYYRTAKRSDHTEFDIFALDNISDTDVYGSSLFGEVSYTLPQTPVELTAGLRRFRDHIDQQDHNSGVPAEPVKGAFSNVNPRFSAAWHVDSLWQIYASAAKGFRSGQSQPSASILVAKTMGLEFPPTLPPDSIWSYELGTKASLLDSRLLVEAAVYHSDWKNFAVRAVLPGTALNALVTSPGTRTNGIEGSLRYEFTKHLSAGVNATYTRARYVATVAGTGITKGSPVDDVAPVVFGGSVDYRFAAFDGWTARTHAGYQHNNRRTSPSILTSLPGDAIDNLNARIGFEKGPWTLALFGENLTNEDGAVTSRGVQPVSATESISSAGRLRPRTIGLELRYWTGR